MTKRINTFDQFIQTTHANKIYKITTKELRAYYVKVTSHTLFQFEPNPFEDQNIPIWGIKTNVELSPTGTHMRIALTEKTFKDGTIVEEAEANEIKGRKFSYEE